MKVKIFYIFLVFLLSFKLHSQENSGTISAQIGGHSFRTALKTLTTETTYELNGGNESEGLKIMWKNINSASLIKPGLYTFPETKDILIGYMDYKNGKPFAVRSGTLNITANTAGKIEGTFEFVVFDGLPSELGGTEVTITNGAFTLIY